MANIREIQSRINSVKDTMKITNAMYMISSSKMTHAKKKLMETEPYFYALQGEISRILRHLPELEHHFFDIRAKIPAEERKIGSIVVTADKGLAGAYNHNVVKLEEEIQKAREETTEKTLKKQQEVWNSCAVVTVTYLFGDQKEVLDGMRVKDWFTYDAEGNYVEDQETLMANIQAYTAELAAKYDTVGRSRVIRSTATGEDVTVEGGDYGFLIDQEEESKQLLQDIQGHVNTEREPVYARRGAVYGENDIGDTYVEVDLTGQHLWYYKDGFLLMDSDFVSGTYYNYERRTPAGSYYLKYKQRDQVLRPAPNPDGSYDYESPVDYWMPFNGGIGFHDADWRWVFGGSIYLYNGSHGCINLPVSFAGEFYNSLEAGCPIICFYR